MSAFSLVFRRAPYLALAIALFPASLLLLLWSGQVLIVRASGVRLFLDWPFVGAALIIALLLALLLPIQVYAFRLAMASVKHAGGTVLGALFATASMSCCTPVILPSILSLLGFTGTTILRVNVTVERYWLPLATISVILLLYSLASITKSVQAECHLDRTLTGAATGSPTDLRP